MASVTSAMATSRVADVRRDLLIPEGHTRQSRRGKLQFTESAGRGPGLSGQFQANGHGPGPARCSAHLPQPLRVAEYGAGVPVVPLPRQEVTAFEQQDPLVGFGHAGGGGRTSRPAADDQDVVVVDDERAPDVDPVDLVEVRQVKVGQRGGTVDPAVCTTASKCPKRSSTSSTPQKPWAQQGSNLWLLACKAK